ncbi:hypothetical protein CJF31_00011311 [Rutstroemia sp. NJR-2017a BVV2]|nr:hypothetical protein CJF31_00011311 [Rutstroemia sp. NJR-2017a BVV2]
MNFRWTTLIAFIVGVTHAIPCSDMGWSTLQVLPTGKYDLMHTTLYPNPLYNDPLFHEHWDIVRANDCYVRFQVPLTENDYKRESARIIKTEFIATPAQVLHTMNNYHGSDGNIMLWLPMTSRAFEYGNVMELLGNHEDFDAQMSLDINYSVMSIILPSGSAKLTRVNPNRADCSLEAKKNVDKAQSAGIVGLQGTIDSSDWAYSSGIEAKMAMLSLKRRQVKYPSTKETEPAWLLAEKADGNCVVIDLTNFVDFTF